MKKNVLFIILSLLCLSGFAQNYKIYKKESTSAFDIKFTLESTSNGYKMYKGRSTFSSDLRYTVEKTSNGFKL